MSDLERSHNRLPPVRIPPSCWQARWGWPGRRAPCSWRRPGRAPAAEVLAAVRGQASPTTDGPAAGESPAWSGYPYLGLRPWGSRTRGCFTGAVNSWPSWHSGSPTAGRDRGAAGGRGVGGGQVLAAQGGIDAVAGRGCLGPGSQRWRGGWSSRRAGRYGNWPCQLAEVAGADPMCCTGRVCGGGCGADAGRVDGQGRGWQRPSPGPREARRSPRSQPRRVWYWWSTSSGAVHHGGTEEATRAEREGFIAALQAKRPRPRGRRRPPGGAGGGPGGARGLPRPALHRQCDI